MVIIELDFFKNKKFNVKKLLKYGFCKKENEYVYTSKIMNGDFVLYVGIDGQNNIKTEITDKETGEIYNLHLTDAAGTFVGQIREEYIKILEDISENCFEINIFKQAQTYEIIDYFRKKYGDDVEYLWEKFPDNAVVRRKDNKKWYAAILTVKKNKIGKFKSSENVEVIDLRVDVEELPKLIESPNYYAGYHMNKKHWISIILDGSVDFDELCKRVDDSYKLAKK